MEALIAASIFAMVSSIAVAFFMNITRTEKKTELTNAIYEDARVIMEMLSNEIRQGTVDYEEYYSMKVKQDNVDATEAKYGINRGLYGSKFYHPGYTIDPDSQTTVLGDNPGNLGVECVLNLGGNRYEKIPCDGGGSIFTLSVDLDMGKNPYDGADNDAESAFCETSPCPNLAEVTELYLISKDGRTKTIIGKKTLNGDGDSILGMLQMVGEDTDGNGVIDSFTCKPEYGCGGTQPTKSDLTHVAKVYQPFVPISPLRSSVKDLKFIITPTEDPYKAFAEIDAQVQPSITMILTLEPSEDQKENYREEPPVVTVQTSVSAGVKNKITTYPPKRDLSEIND